MQTSSKNYDKAIQYIEHHGYLLIFPIKNQDYPLSLWDCLYPGAVMRWDWDSGADQRVIDLWFLREELARRQEVVYGKYFRGRATVFSKKYFLNLLAVVGTDLSDLTDPISKNILEALEVDSPLSTKQLREVTGLKGRMLEGTFHKSVKHLWQRFALVGIGEIDDGAFPSLAHGATSVVFEDIWNASREIDPGDAYLTLLNYQSQPPYL